MHGRISFFRLFRYKKYRLFTGAYNASYPHSLLEDVEKRDKTDTKEERKEIFCIGGRPLFGKEKRDTVGKEKTFSGWCYPLAINLY
jgi:hypothetical protein